MAFSQFLKNNVNKSKYSRTELIAQLNLFHNEFQNLDSVTLSRWVTNKTNPSLYKQLLICLYFKQDLYHFIKNKLYTTNKTNLNFEKKVNTTMGNIEKSIQNISYLYNKNQKPKFFVTLNSKEEYRNKFKVFYNNFNLYKKFFRFIDENSLSPQTITCEERINSIMVSHDSLAFVDKKHKTFFEQFFKVNIDIDDFWFANVGFHSSKESLNTSFTLMVYWLIKNNSYDFLSLVRGEDAFNNYQELGYKQIRETIIEGNEKFYLCQVNLLEVLSNQYVISEVSRLFNKLNINDIFSDELLS
ncbi:hypothetical protein [Photobacterium damselae]|uniref:hypothetical protein n=1 Tax=Photobacterium damselae TaxID=38293 RepID=UPI001EDE9881|nr:hypothetical protein [Photobacterium damselae]MCG3823122.1 hypothetical protein [Photobacterium damselae]